MTEWKDVTSYTQTARAGESEARTWALHASNHLAIVVTRHIGDKSNTKWFLRCSDLHIDLWESPYADLRETQDAGEQVTAIAFVPSTIIPIDTPWKPGDYAVRERLQKPALIVGHWTAGTGGKTFTDDLDTVWKRMRARKNPDGKPLKVSVHYVIGRDGAIGEYADPLTTVCMGVGNSSINSRAIHVEVVSPGVGRPSEKYPSRVVERVVRGRTIKCLAFLPAQIESWRELVSHLCAVHDIPRMAVMRTTALSQQEAKTFSGVMEHQHVPGTTKIDAAGMLCDAAFAGGAL